MNSFDAAVYLCLLVALVIGFRAGLLRSTVTILGYLIAMPIAAWITTLIVPQLGGITAISTAQNSVVFFGAFLISGIVMGSLLRMAVNDMIGSEIGLGDRLAGAGLGAIRVGLIAITLVLIFDQMLPVQMQPSYMTGSQLRPWLSSAGQRGFKSLPPEVAGYIEQWKREHRI